MFEVDWERPDWTVFYGPPDLRREIGRMVELMREMEELIPQGLSAAFQIEDWDFFDYLLRLNRVVRPEIGRLERILRELDGVEED